MKLSDLNTSEYLSFYQTYLDNLPDENLIEILESTKRKFALFLASLKDDDLKKKYEPGKWTVAEVLQHILDTERIFQYRALTLAREDSTKIPGFDQDAYVPSSKANQRDLQSFIFEFDSVRNAGIALFQSFDDEMLKATGNVNGANFSVRAAGFISAGHQTHHLQLFKSRYVL
ncbi:MAG: DinB family protein [Gillisia sp.]